MAEAIPDKVQEDAMTEGWEQVAPTADEDAWDWVYRKLDFRPSVRPADWPGFREPLPSITWSLRGTEGADFAVSEDAVNHLGITTLQQCVPLDEWIWALDWQHLSYRCRPHHVDQIDDWPISIFPNGDYTLFLSQDFNFGVLGHPWEMSLCIFGKELIDAVHHRNLNILTNAIRRNL